MKKIQIDLSNDEALVLFEFLSRFADGDSLHIVDQAEERALWDLQARLETKLAEPLKADYAELLAAARSAVRDPD